MGCCCTKSSVKTANDQDQSKPEQQPEPEQGAQDHATKPDDPPAKDDGATKAFEVLDTFANPLTDTTSDSSSDDGEVWEAV